jgi:transcriptional regulator with XRE-family HTH domain
MAEVDAGSTVPRRQLGRYLRELRADAGLTVRAAAKELERSEPTLWRIENGLTSTRSVEVGVMCRLYGADEQLTAALMALAKQTKAKGWWLAYGDALPEGFDLFADLEAAATMLDEYEHSLVPGLLQSEGYARTIMTAHRPQKTADEIDRRVELRRIRQAILTRMIDPPRLRVLLCEQVLRTPVGGREVMAAQLDHLAEVSELPNASLRVLSPSAGYHPGILTGAFTVMRFPPPPSGLHGEPPTIYKETYTGSLYLDKPDEIERFATSFEAIWDVALSEQPSRDLIARTAEDMRHG